MYEEGRSRVPGAVRWSSTPQRPTRVLPDGCLDLLWYGDALVVAGPDTTAFISEVSSTEPVAGLRFAPGVGPGVFGLPASELRDHRVRLDEWWSANEVRLLSERVATAADRCAAPRAGGRPQAGGVPARAHHGGIAGAGGGVVGLSGRGRRGLSGRQLQRALTGLISPA